MLGKLIAKAGVLMPLMVMLDDNATAEGAVHALRHLYDDFSSDDETSFRSALLLVPTRLQLLLGMITESSNTPFGESAAALIFGAVHHGRAGSPRRLCCGLALL